MFSLENAQFRDQGTADVHSAIIDWGDGTTSSLDVHDASLDSSARPVPRLVEPNDDTPGQITYG